jgi:hypothetical protein
MMVLHESYGLQNWSYLVYYDTMLVDPSLSLTYSILSKPISYLLERKSKELDLFHLHYAFGISSICSFHSSKCLLISFLSVNPKKNFKTINLVYKLYDIKKCKYVFLRKWDIVCHCKLVFFFFVTVN